MVTAAAGESMRRRVQVSAYLGAVIEWYDFYLYGFAAATVLNVLFFPRLDAAAGIIASFATLAVGFVARPLGALIFAHYGDRVGRRGVLVVTLSAMGVASTLIGLLPTYATAGIWAPILLVTLRLLQGVSAGGEWGGAVLVTVEHAATGRRGLAASLPQVGLFTGVLLANGVFFVASLLPDEEFRSWGWRVPFLSSIVLVGIALWIRLRVTESPVFEAARSRGALSRQPLIDLLRYRWRALLVAVLLVIGLSSFSAFEGVFLTSYAIQLGFSTSEALAMTLVGTSLAVLMLPLSAHLSDRYGRRRLVATGTILAMAAASVVLSAVGTGNLVLSIAAVALLWITHSVAYGPLAAWLSELFPTGSRYGGVSIGYQVAVTLGAGMFPLIAAALLAAAGGVPHHGLVLAYVLAGCLLTLAGTRMAGETAYDSFSRIDERADLAVSRRN